MSATREKIYHFVRGRIMEGHPPTIREVARAAGLKAVESARSHLEALVGEGRLVKLPGRARGYALPNKGKIPLLGRVQAGALSYAEEDLEGYLPADGPADNLFALTVSGESMKEAGIFPGDVVIVRKQPTARHGEIVVALVEDEATVKRLHLKNNRVELHPENPGFAPIVPEGEVIILGKVVEVRRTL